MSDELYAGRIASLIGIRPFFRNSKEDYVILSDCHVVGNIDYDRMLKAHMDSGADITVACKHGDAPQLNGNLLLWMGEDGRVNDIMLGHSPAGECDFGLGLYIMRKDFLTRMLDAAASRNQMNFDRDILLRHLDDVRIFGYCVPEYTAVISSPGSFFSANMALLNADVRAALFQSQRQIYTKVRGRRARAVRAARVGFQLLGGGRLSDRGHGAQLHHFPGVRSRGMPGGKQYRDGRALSSARKPP